MSKALVQNSHIVSKKGTVNGREVVAFFRVFENGTGYAVELVGIRPLSEAEPLTLAPLASKNSAPIVEIASPFAYETPYIKNIFAFLVNQSPRAPAV